MYYCLKESEDYYIYDDSEDIIYHHDTENNTYTRITKTSGKAFLKYHPYIECYKTFEKCTLVEQEIDII